MQLGIRMQCRKFERTKPRAADLKKVSLRQDSDILFYVRLMWD